MYEPYPATTRTHRENKRTSAAATHAINSILFPFAPNNPSSAAPQQSAHAPQPPLPLLPLHKLKQSQPHQSAFPAAPFQSNAHTVQIQLPFQSQMAVQTQGFAEYMHGPATTSRVRIPQPPAAPNPNGSKRGNKNSRAGRRKKETTKGLVAQPTTKLKSNRQSHASLASDASEEQSGDDASVTSAESHRRVAANNANTVILTLNHAESKRSLPNSKSFHGPKGLNITHTASSSSNMNAYGASNNNYYAPTLASNNQHTASFASTYGGNGAYNMTYCNSNSSPVPPKTAASVTSLGNNNGQLTSSVSSPALTPAAALKQYYSILTPYEQSEILECQQVYFVGRPNASKVRGIPHTACNSGYDDDRGDYRIVVHDHIAFRYEVVQVLGKGSFGQVVKALDHKTGHTLALKLIRNKARFHQQALTEVRLLEHLRDKDPDHNYHLVHIQEYFYHRNHLCITFELLSINLYELIKNNNFVGLSMNLIRRFATQMLTSLQLLRQENVIHCDLKPENVLLVSPNRSAIKLIDFGSSCFSDECVYSYIQSRFYRSPEVILGAPYGMPIDMWSFGCILAELYTGYPLFPGENEVEQLQCMMEILGVPPKSLLDRSTRKHKFFDEAGVPRIVPNSRGRVRKPGTKDLASVLRTEDNYFLSFLRQCLKWEPKSRLNPVAAMEHPWVTEGQAPSLTQSHVTLPPATPQNQSLHSKNSNVVHNVTIPPLPISAISAHVLVGSKKDEPQSSGARHRQAHKEAEEQSNQQPTHGLNLAATMGGGALTDRKPRDKPKDSVKKLSKKRSSKESNSKSMNSSGSNRAANDSPISEHFSEGDQTLETAAEEGDLDIEENVDADGLDDSAALNLHAMRAQELQAEEVEEEEMSAHALGAEASHGPSKNVLDPELLEELAEELDLGADDRNQYVSVTVGSGGY